MPNSEDAPTIAPVADDDSRPFWSVMIPTYNCAKYLRKTLESVLSQDVGPESMQIEVIDDVSTKDDPEAVVREIAGSQVAFFRNPENLGAARNFNRCIERSRGHWVHILHGDDYILPNFYKSLSNRIVASPEIGIASCRAFFVDENGEIDSLTPRIRQWDSSSTYFPPINSGNPLQTPSVVVKRSSYERLGGFLPELVHTADWEMWHRISTSFGGVMVNEPLACYRVFSANDSSRLIRMGENLRDVLRFSNVIRSRDKDMDISKCLAVLAQRALAQAAHFETLGDTEAVRANKAVYLEFATPLERLRRTCVVAIRRLSKAARK